MPSETTAGNSAAAARSAPPAPRGARACAVPRARAPSRSRWLGPQRLRRSFLCEVLGERFEGTVGRGGQAKVREEARHHDALRELADPGLRALAGREGEDELGVAPSGRLRERERAAEARVHVGDAVLPVRAAEALDRGD